MGIYELIIKRRTIRKFQQQPISSELLTSLVNAGRVAPSGANLQPLEFIIVNKKGLVDQVFSTLKWAGYIAPAGNPPEGKQPTAYIIVLINTEIKKEKGEVDAAAAMENMILAALDKGIGSCWIGSINRKEIRNIFGLSDLYKIDSILALGYPDESPVLEETEDSIKYWKDESGRLHVPKRKMENVLHVNGFDEK
ncbi:nitroreductase family protein [candidate division KSB1 bacterium]|nr:nitroreductase family protein [candidate division KSB1 bacterium]MBL7095736.1 nitroreductase family protein [candidate division KSB1 bacterium]